MKFIHTGDWHIGKLVHQIHMTEDQRFILQDFIRVVAEEKPHAIIIAGDIYDRSVPPVEAVELLDEVFSTILIELNTPIIAISGNHDSPDRLGFGSKILRNKGLYIEGKLTKNIKSVVLEDEFGPVNFHPIPYADPAIVRELMDDSTINNHDSAMKAIINQVKSDMNPGQRNVIIAHGFVIGGESLETSESERPLSIGGSEYIDVTAFMDFNYTALGHLHSPQKVAVDKIRYPGSLLKYSFSEARQKKSVTVVEMDKAGGTEIRKVSLTPKRDMRKIQGKLLQLTDPAIYKDTNIDDYVMVTLLDEGELLDAIGKLRGVYPNVLRLERSQLKGIRQTNGKMGSDYHRKSKLELFREFYEAMEGDSFKDDYKEILIDVLSDIEKEERGK
ncbi:exonuclease SbcCD subunit D [Alkaliphilus peptidifermentans]|uniref:Nuclease SbcCD subunit D n=1 Tax=Alkaliphilus peptidifermentans DSM 18978 TaxID=1120976 RepID=A0A1G5GKG3_9FIRM|nr:exonuclease SbcCD subunit D [Alkaliphilus peptidifermentans]SCY51871.1 Exodeoxyribonuclease I subunit D [Alkaliphilus peptidifermentans DSM 18978]